jgi:hypothetical protein
VIRYARYLGSFPTPATEQWSLAGQDGGQSIALGDNGQAQTLFVFSDSLFVLPAPPPHSAESRPPFALDVHEPVLFLANCAAVGHGRDLRQSLADMRYLCDAQGYPRPILPATATETRAGLRFWPAHGLCTEEGVYLFYLGIQTVDPGSMWGFRNQGVGLAVLDPASGESRRVLADGRWRLWQSRADDFHFGVQVVRQGDEVFVFGSVRHGFDTSAFVARVPAGQIAEPPAYRYLTRPAGEWSSDLADAGSLGPCGSDYSIAFNRHLGQYVMTYIDSFTKVLCLRLADDLAGPYSAPRPVGRVPHQRDSELVYLGFEHPRFAQGDGERVYISYCQPYFAPSSLMELCFR